MNDTFKIGDEVKTTQVFNAKLPWAIVRKGNVIEVLNNGNIKVNCIYEGTTDVFNPKDLILY